MQNKENKVFDDDLTGEKERDLELLNKMNPDFFQRMMQNTDQAGMKPIEDRVDEFLGKVTDSNGMNSVGVQQKKQQTMMAHDYDEDPYIRKTIMEIINTPGYDPASVKEAQRQLLRMNQGLPRFPTA